MQMTPVPTAAPTSTAPEYLHHPRCDLRSRLGPVVAHGNDAHGHRPYRLLHERFVSESLPRVGLGHHAQAPHISDHRPYHCAYQVPSFTYYRRTEWQRQHAQG